MQVSIEISMYPLADNYIPPIQSFIDALNSHSEIKVVENTMSTQVFGEYDETMRIVQEEIKKASQGTPTVSFVMKLIPKDLSPNG